MYQAIRTKRNRDMKAGEEIWIYSNPNHNTNPIGLAILIDKIMDCGKTLEFWTVQFIETGKVKQVLVKKT